MGAFYKTSDPQNLDYMYQPNQGLMMKIIEQNNKVNDAAIHSYDLLGDNLLKVKAVPGTVYEDALNAKKQEYQQDMQTATSNIQKDPMNYRQNMPQVRELQRKVMNDYTNGVIGAAQQTSDSATKWQQDISTRIAKNPELAPWANAEYQEWKKGLTDPTKASTPPDVSDPQNLNDYVDKYMKEVKPIKSDISGVNTGMYIVNTEHGTEEVSAPRLHQMILERIGADPTISKQIQLGTKYGIYSKPEAILDTPQGTVYDPFPNEVHNAINAGINTYAYSDNKVKQTATGNSIYEQQQGFANEDRKHNRDRKEDLIDAASDREDKLEDLKSTREYKKTDEDHRMLLDLYKKGYETSGAEGERLLKIAKSVESGDLAGITSATNKITYSGDNIHTTKNTDYDTDMQTLLVAKQDRALQSNDPYLKQQAETELQTVTNRLVDATTFANQNLRKSGYTQVDIDLYNKTMHSPGGLESLKNKAADVNYGTSTEPGLGGDFDKTPTEASKNYAKVSKMDKVFKESQDTYYKNTINKSHTVTSVDLTGQLSPVKSLAIDYINKHPENIILSDLNEGDTYKGKIDPKKLEVNRLFADNGAKFMVKYDGKDYVASTKDKTNLEDLVAQHLSGVKDNRDVEYIGKQLSEPQRNTILTATRSLQAGDNTTVTLPVPIKQPNGSVQTKLVKVKLGKSINGDRYTANIIDPNTGQPSVSPEGSAINTEGNIAEWLISKIHNQ